MSIMTDARLRLLEVRVAEIERRLGESAGPPGAAASKTPAPPAKPVPAAKKNAPKRRKPQRKKP